MTPSIPASTGIYFSDLAASANGFAAPATGLPVTDADADAAPTDRPHWLVLRVDADPTIHRVTRLALAGAEVIGRPVRLLQAESSAAALALLREHPDIALLLTDVDLERRRAGLDLVRCLRQVLGRRAPRVVLCHGSSDGPAIARRWMVEHDIQDCQPRSDLGVHRLFATVVAGVRAYRDLLALEHTRGILQAIVGSCAALFAPHTPASFADEALRQATGFPFIEEGVFVDMAADAGVASFGDFAFPRVVARRAAPGASGSLTWPPGLLLHAGALPHLVVSEGPWHACCLRMERAGRAVLMMRGAREISDDEWQLLDLFMRHVALAFDHLLRARESTPLRNVS